MKKYFAFFFALFASFAVSIASADTTYYGYSSVQSPIDPIIEFDDTGKVKQMYITAGDQKIAVIRRLADTGPSANEYVTEYLHPDSLGNISVITDKNGAHKQFTSYDPFGGVEYSRTKRIYGGEPAFHSSGFLGKERNSTAGLTPGSHSYISHRLLDHMHGRWLREEPLVFGVVPELQFLQEPGRLNSYSYSFNNPFKYVDKDGKKPNRHFLTKPDLGGGYSRGGTAPNVRGRFRTNQIRHTRLNQQLRQNYVRRQLPKIDKSIKNAFDGPVKIRTFRQGDRIYRSPQHGELRKDPSSWFSTRLTKTIKGTESNSNIMKYNNPAEKIRIYEFNTDVTVYYGKVKGGTGYQIHFPQDIRPGKVLNYLSESKLK